MSLDSAERQFMENPLASARSLCKDNQIGRRQLRRLFSNIRQDVKRQCELDLWGPGGGFVIQVLGEILAHPETLEAIYRGFPVHPWFVEFQPGTECPCACDFCFNKGGSVQGMSQRGRYQDRWKTKSLSGDDILAIIKTAVGHGCDTVHFSGGLEPFTSPVILDVLRNLPYIPRVAIRTNGVTSNLNGMTLNTIVRRASELRFSVHAATAETYDIVQRPQPNGAFLGVVERIEMAIQCQRYSLEMGYPAAQIGISFLPTPANYHELEQAADMWAERGVNFMNIANDVLEGDKRAPGLSAEQEAQLEESCQRIIDRAASGLYGQMVVRPSRKNIRAQLKASPMKCYAPLLRANIDPYGNRWTCCLKAQPSMNDERFLFGAALSGLEKHKAFEPYCKDCCEYEYIANVVVEKFLDDRTFEIDFAEQPFRLASVTHTAITPTAEGERAFHV